MEREQMRMAILNQEQTFRQQVHELHRLYHVQKQLMGQMQIAKLNQARAVAAEAKIHEQKPKFEINFAENSINHQQLYSFQTNKISSSPAAAAQNEEEKECDLELTLATGSSSSSSRSSTSRQHKGKEVKSSNSDSGTAVSSTSTESELAQLKEHHLDFAAAAAAAETAPVRFLTSSEMSKKRQQVGAVVEHEMNLQPPWLNQCLSLRMA
ncbi:uncharacterized protein LOC102707256 [Oryza brachyantha]|uniref:uncharacterized protein LOC102707256 n=1 Tax=Oryza brachyantha TaxID=4533 RepID=UPI001AD977E5|nr:uncharacterized protein LOC102707256 [Oryza brachyantha]